MGTSFRVLTACLLAILLGVLVAGVAFAQPGRGIVGPSESIQRAVNAAERGDIILVRGTHRETVVIRKDGIALVGGKGAELRPPARPAGPCGPSGFCVFGSNSNRVANVSITNFTVRNFGAFGIMAFGARDAKFVKNRAFNNGEYGIAAFSSTGTKVFSNVTGNDGEAGIYIGDSPRANATVAHNETYGNELGIFVRNARHGKILGNQVHNNCVGMLFLADAPGPAGNFEVRGNTVRKNTRSCPAGEEGPPISGVGIALLGARGMEIGGNQVLGNVPSGPTALSGGVVVVRGFGGTPPTNNSVVGNRILHNRPDIFWDRSGSGNRFAANDCETSKPRGLCDR
jgi:parallel beta helix pectate lyase-like protein